MSKPLVSVGLPVYNAASTLPRVLDSLLAQDLEDFEVIVSDNASTDETRDVVEAATDPGIGIILMDVILGYGAHPDPASELMPVLQKCQRIADDRKRALAVVIVLCGTSGDAQSFSHQKAALESAGAIVVRSNAQAALIAAALARADLSLV